MEMQDTPVSGHSYLLVSIRVVLPSRGVIF